MPLMGQELTSQGMTAEVKEDGAIVVGDAYLMRCGDSPPSARGKSESACLDNRLRDAARKEGFEVRPVQ